MLVTKLHFDFIYNYLKNLRKSFDALYLEDTLYFKKAEFICFQFKYYIFSIRIDIN